MALDGFSQKWKDFPDYIIGITKEIWEDRGLHTLHHYYAEDIPVRSPAGLVIGNQNVINATMATLADFPDRTLFGEDVIWSVDDTGHYLSSHRIVSTVTHVNDGIYGPATGIQLTYHIIADCAARDNTIDDEWLIRDHGAIVRQIGWDPKDFAAHTIKQEGGPDKCAKPFHPEMDVDGPYKGTGNDDPWGVRYADILTRIMGGELNVIPDHYDRAVHCQYAGGVSGHSHSAVDKFWTSLRSSFPNATFKIDHQIGREDPMMPPRGALRWSLQGKHEGWGRFGEPTGADVYIMGLSHAEFGPYGREDGSIRREYALFDEVAVWKQILMQSGSQQ